ncbi:cytidylate kinase [archaeon SCG-AAA382B04]|nr:cytidylate kinase [archaeon SCG-AAA382B04]
MKVAISGRAGSGTSTTAEKVAKKLGMEFIGAGDIFRRMAKQKNMSLQEFGKYAEKNPEIDKEIDQKQREISQKREKIVIEGRLAGWMAEADIKIWLKAPLKLRAKRVAKRDQITHEKALKRIQKREKSEKKRYKKFYDINIYDKSIYGLIIDTSKWNQNSVVEIIEKSIKNFSNET